MNALARAYSLHFGAAHLLGAPGWAVPLIKFALHSPLVTPAKAHITMALKPPPLGEVIQQVNEIVAGNGIKGEVDKSVKSLAQAALQRLDMVSREEFDAQTEVLRRTRAKVVSLEAELEDMQKALETATSKD